MKRIDFENGTVTRNIFSAAIPMLVAQILSLLYNIVDWSYIARIPNVGTTALGAVGICFPLILDSLFIFVFGFGILGAAIATVISQFLSAAFIFMDLQYMGQTVFKSLNKKKQAIFFSLLRKVSNVIGGSLCFVTMLLTVLSELKRMEN
ncbi:MULTISPECIES: hypothetical protein [unclassified Ruminococcus]|uniref:hypothetical protein n=1 Tax=unclassified Ruminococcus TaxID=2608920 RepID=UPI00319E6F5D